MRLVVTGRNGQVATALLLSGLDSVEVIGLGRPELDLERLDTLEPALRAARPDVVVSAAAYTAVDAAETDAERAALVNAQAPGVLAQAAARLGAPVIHLSTDYVFDGTKPSPYVEADPVGPRTVYGATKLEGERAVAAANPRHVVLRTAWVYAPYGKNFVRTMLRLAETRDRLNVVGDQVGNPTYAPDIAAGILAVARALHRGEGDSGVYHMSGAGEASWAQFASAVFECARRRGVPSATVQEIGSIDYPTAAERPKNSRMDCTRLAESFGVALPDWRSSLDRCLDALCSRP